MPEDIRELARQYAGTKSAAIRVGVALERHQGGGQAIRAVCCLPSLTGAWREVGWGASLHFHSGNTLISLTKCVDLIGSLKGRRSLTTCR